MWISVFTYWERCPVTSKMYMLIFCIHQNRNSIGFLFDKCDRNVFNLMTLNLIALVIARDHGNTFNEDREFIFLNSLFIIYFSKFLIHLNFIKKSHFNIFYSLQGFWRHTKLILPRLCDFQVKRTLKFNFSLFLMKFFGMNSLFFCLM